MIRTKKIKPFTEVAKHEAPKKAHRFVSPSPIHPAEPISKRLF
jgi:hypothetical protein